MDSVNFLNLMDKFEAGKEGEREKEGEYRTDYRPQCNHIKKYMVTVGRKEGAQICAYKRM